MGIFSGRPLDSCDALSGQRTVYWVGRSDNNSKATFFPQSTPVGIPLYVAPYFRLDNNIDILVCWKGRIEDFLWENSVEKMWKFTKICRYS